MTVHCVNDMSPVPMTGVEAELLQLREVTRDCLSLFCLKRTV